MNQDKTTDSRKTKRPRVLIVYHYFALYRLPIMNALLHSDQVDYFFAAGTKTDRNINLVDEIEFGSSSKKLTGVNRWLSLRNCWIRKPFLWQMGLIWRSLFARFDAIVFLGDPHFLSTWIAIPLARFGRKKVYLWTHGTLRGKNAKDRLKKRMYKMADMLFLYGNWAKQQLVNEGFDSEKIAVIYNSLDYAEQVKRRAEITQQDITETRKRLFKFDQLPVVFFIGRLIKQKQLPELVQAVKSLHERNCPINLLLIGDGEDRPLLERLVRQEGLGDYVCFFGACHDEKTLAPLIMSSDICVSPGGIGLTAMHSLAYGTPVITHDNPFKQGPEFETISSGRNGAFYDHTNTEDIANQIQEWLLRNVDRNEVRKTCYENIEKFYNPDRQQEIMDRLILGESVSSIELSIGKPATE